MKKEIEDKIGTLHLRLADNEEQYAEMLAHLVSYNRHNKHYTKDVISALEDGLENYSRFQRIDNALSARFIQIVKRSFAEGQKLKANDTEGAYHLIFHFDDNEERTVHFSRKQDQVLYMLILLTSLKNGYSSDFLRKTADSRYQQVKATVGKLVETVYPVGDASDDVIQCLDPEVYFTDCVQKMKGAISQLLAENEKQHEERWFMPYTLNSDKKRVYQMHIEPTRIIYPDEFQPIVDALPLAGDYVDMSSFVAEDMEMDDYNRLLQGVQRGDISSMNQLAYAYKEGIGRIRNLDKAFSLWKKTAEMGDAEGLYYMGIYYSTGDVVSQDYAKSADYFQKAAAQGHADALYQLGIIKMHGFGCAVDWNEALNCFKQAALRGSDVAAYEAGYLYDRGEHGVAKDDTKASIWFIRAAKMGCADAVKYVIRAYHDGMMEDKDHQNFKYWVERAIDLSIPELNLQMALFFYQEKEYEPAYALFKAASESGWPVAYHPLSRMAYQGLGVEKDEELAREYIYKGARLGDELCLNDLSKLDKKLWREISKELARTTDMRALLLKLVGKMKSDADQEYFLKLIDTYRERFHEDYQKEINKQLSIHRPSTDRGGSPKRKIQVRPSSSGRAHYEIVVTLANGQEIQLRLNPNSLMLMLLAIICSYKSGYNTLMTLDRSCRTVMKRLISMGLGLMSNDELDNYIYQFMGEPKGKTKVKTDYYKQYSNLAKREIVNAIGDNDDAIHFLFDNNDAVGRRPLRSMNLDVNEISLPQDLLQLANDMPDGRKILYDYENEGDMYE